MNTMHGTYMYNTEINLMGVVTVTFVSTQDL